MMWKSTIWLAANCRQWSGKNQWDTVEPRYNLEYTKPLLEVPYNKEIKKIAGPNSVINLRDLILLPCAYRETSSSEYTSAVIFKVPRYTCYFNDGSKDSRFIRGVDEVFKRSHYNKVSTCRYIAREPSYFKPEEANVCPFHFSCWWCWELCPPSHGREIFQFWGSESCNLVHAVMRFFTLYLIRIWI